MSISFLPFFDGPGTFPGMTDSISTLENQVWFGDVNQLYTEPKIVDGASRDAGNTGNTNILRPGLLMGTVTTSGKLKQWNPLATDGTEQISHVLGTALSTTRNGSDADLLYYVFRFGSFKIDGLCIASESTNGISGKNYEYLVVSQARELGWRLDGVYGLPGTVKAVTADVTLTAADCFKYITNAGAAATVTVTLPAPKAGYRFRFGTVNAQTFAISAGTGNVITGGNATVTLTPAGDTCDVLGVFTASTGTPKYQLLQNLGGALS